MKIIKKFINYLKEVRLEMKKINWPTKKETLKYTLLVIGVSLTIAVFLGLFDFLFTLILNKII